MSSDRQACARLGEAHAAQAFAGRARAAAQFTGSQWLSQLAADAQRSIGARLPRRSRQVPFALTQREEQVAWLAAQGLSSGDIGKRLFISPRTVETHLSRVFRKLGVTTRSALGLRLSGIRDLPDAG